MISDFGGKVRGELIRHIYVPARDSHLDRLIRNLAWLLECWPTSPFRKAFGIVSPLESLPAQGHHQVFSVFPDQSDHCLAVKFSRALGEQTPVVRGDAHAA